MSQGHRVSVNVTTGNLVATGIRRVGPQREKTTVSHLQNFYSPTLGEKLTNRIMLIR